MSGRDRMLRPLAFCLRLRHMRCSAAEEPFWFHSDWQRDRPQTYGG
ncbi:hypothetical protein IL54_1755 [Sphingobium sp. ba1]|nr:hypothetical protein IL54_1755 [Sphingobium sp. ba1]